MYTIKKYTILLVILALTACGKSGLEGVYTALGGVQELNFNHDGTVVQSLMGSKVAEHKYELDGNEIKIRASDSSSYILTILENGDIQGPGNLVFTLKK
ncbi:MAG: hypothetical protein GXP06_03135 [Alphaproteobacteria bacterium]|nr:hypothetical protein [Alphaproteobacteria bacterium]